MAGKAVTEDNETKRLRLRSWALEGAIEAIQDSFPELIESDQEYLLLHLGAINQGIRNYAWGDLGSDSLAAYVEAALPNFRRLKKKQEGDKFSGSQAKRIREIERLSQSDLAKTLGVTQVTISSWENNRQSPSPKKESTRNYLFWLKERGYDPYDLGDKK